MQRMVVCFITILAVATEPKSYLSHGATLNDMTVMQTPEKVLNVPLIDAAANEPITLS